MRYEDYLKSEHWKSRRYFRGQKSKWTCERCGAKDKPIHIHHLNYNHLWNESDEDLECLCEDCHWWEHHRIPDLDELLKQLSSL
jgi:hypothetical protein